jgi:hypothetical protein
VPATAGVQVQLATLLVLSVPVQAVAVPSMKVTLPVGTTPLAELFTVLERVSDEPMAAVVVEAVIVLVVVLRALIVSLTVVEVLAKFVASPE